MEPLARGCPSAQGSHVRLGPLRRSSGQAGLVDEDEVPGVKPPLILLPLRAPPGDLRAQLFGGKNTFF